MFSKYILRDEKGKITGVAYPPEKVRIVIEKYPNHTIAECVEFSGLSKGVVYKIARKNGVEKSAEFKQKQIEQFLKVGENTRIKKGTVSHNKGKKQIEYMSQEAIDRSSVTRFKKGSIPANRKPIGSERIGKDGCIDVKVKHGSKWQFKHRIVWEQHYGAIPNGYNIQFKDRNTQNYAIENLYIISRKNQIRTNTIHNYPEDVKKAMRAVSKLKRTIKKLRK